MSEQTIQGRLILILPLESGTSKAGSVWQKQDFVIETEGDHPKKICFTLFGDKLNLIDGIGVGCLIDVAYNIESRDFNGKWYHNINAWKINVVSAPVANDFGVKANDAPEMPAMANDDENNLPF